MDKTIKEYLESLQVSELTMQSYENALGHFDSFLKDKRKTVLSIEAKELATYSDYLQKNMELGVSSIRGYINAVKRLYKHLEEHGVTRDESYLLRLPKAPTNQLPKFLTNREVVRLFEEVSKEDNEFLKVRNTFAVNMLVYHGLRVQELTDLRIDSIKDDVVTVVGKGNKARVLVLTDVVLKGYEDYLKVRKSKSEQLLVSEEGRPIQKRAIQYMVQRYLDNAGLGQFSVHSLRHTCAVLMMDNGLDIKEVQEVLGHTDIATTQIYASVSTQNKRRIANVMDSIAM